MPKFTSHRTEAMRVYEVGMSYQPFEDVYGFHVQYTRTFIFNFAFRHRLAYYTQFNEGAALQYTRMFGVTALEMIHLSLGYQLYLGNTIPLEAGRELSNGFVVQLGLYEPLEFIH